MKCKDCRYCQSWDYETRDKVITMAFCTLTSTCVNHEVENDCKCFNKDLSEYDICYNCKYYRGGGDWGLFCSHPDMYHHLGKFNDIPCNKYEKISSGKS